MHAVDKDRNSDCETGGASLEIFSLHKIDRNIIWLTPWVVGERLKMKLDTGSAEAAISHWEY